MCYPDQLPLLHTEKFPIGSGERGEGKLGYGGGVKMWCCYSFGQQGRFEGANIFETFLGFKGPKLWGALESQIYRFRFRTLLSKKVSEQPIRRLNC
jgi:hypothetical protein